MMLYCPKCQVLSRDGKTCPSCYGRKLREVRPDDPVLLLTTDEATGCSIKAAFDANKIEYEERVCGTGGISPVILGRTAANYRIFVPYHEISRCKSILLDIGVLDEQGNKVRLSPAGETEENEKQMSPLKRFWVRALSAVLFIILIWLAVTAADWLVSVVQAIF